MEGYRFKYKQYFSYFTARVILNVIFVILLKFSMIDTIKLLPKFSINLGNTPQSKSDIDVFFNNSSYIFNETSILVTTCGLILVALMSLQFVIGTFAIIDNESIKLFRIRLSLYSIGSLCLNCIISLYLFILIGLVSYPNSLRMNIDNSFIWEDVSYTIISFLYIIDAYNFMTKNNGKL